MAQALGATGVPFFVFDIEILNLRGSALGCLQSDPCGCRASRRRGRN
jgi:hypothetical protein